LKKPNGSNGGTIMKRFEGKVAFVTGAGSGIGFAAAQRIAAEGGRVVCGVQSEAQRAATGDLESVIIDVADEDSWATTIEAVVKSHGGIDVLVCCAGILRKGNAEETSLDLWNEVLSVNLNGVFLGARHVVPIMRERGGGAIVNISSLNGIRGTPGALAYAASKGGVVAVTMSMALDYAADNIRVNCICPGSVHTPMVQAVYAQTPDPEAARQARVALHPLGRDGVPEDIAATIAFLASSDASFMTGQAIAVDGGRSAVG
jgi:NAD(P)-dependent dehydrogenase (short-subunit alcohol dehydrogenase family)